MKKLIAVILLFSIIFSTLIGCNEKPIDSSVDNSTSNETQTDSTPSTEAVDKEEKEEEKETTEEKNSEEKSEPEETKKEETKKEETEKEESKKEETKKEETKKEETKKPSSTTVKAETNKLFPGYKYNTNLDINDNVFLDALEYTGYNLKKHRKDGLMWKYILSNDKKHRNWLSDITYGGGSTGLETTKKGLPNISKFEKGGLVCASFATYVYFNYLPNVAKIDTSSLALPEKTYSAESFQEACKKWLKKGYTYNIGFTAKNTASGISFKADEEIPLGSIIVFRDIDKPSKKKADHITVYVGKKNGYHWVIQTGNKNGPEFCAVERFKFGPDPQWPLEIYATPTCIYDAINNPDKK